MLTTKTSKSALLLGGVNGQRNPPGGGGPKRVVTRRRRTKDEDANTTHTNKKKLRLPRAFAREYPTYDELPGRPHEGRKPETNINGGWQPTGNEEEDFFFNNTPREPQRHTRGRRNDGNLDFYGGGIAISPSSTSSSSSSFSAAARDWFELCFMALKTTVPLTAICACVAAASMNSARYTMLSQVYQLATGMTTAGVILSGFAVFASVMSGFFVAASAFADFGGASTRSANANYAQRRKKKSTTKKKKNGGNAPPRQTRQNVVTNYEQQHDDEYIIDSNEQQQSYQQQQPVQQYQQRRKAVERYEPPMVHPTRPPSSPSKRAAREAYDSWTPEIPIVDPRAHVPRPSDVDYYENSSSASRLGGSQPEWDRNESWGSYKSPGQRRREMGYEFKGTQALKNYVDPRDQYERRVSNLSLIHI